MALLWTHSNTFNTFTGETQFCQGQDILELVKQFLAEVWNLYQQDMNKKQ